MFKSLFFILIPRCWQQFLNSVVAVTSQPPVLKRSLWFISLLNIVHTTGNMIRLILNHLHTYFLKIEFGYPNSV